MSTLPNESTTNDEMVSPPKGKFHLSNLAQRFLTAAFVLPLTLFGTIAGGWVFLVLSGLITVFGIMEFYMLAQHKSIHANVVLGVFLSCLAVLAFYFDQHIWLLAILAIGAVSATLLFLWREKTQPEAAKVGLGQLPLNILLTLGGIVYIATPAGMLVELRNHTDGIIWVMLVFALTWGTDTWAYIGGRLLGRTKLAPTISPKKTVEGAIVGVLSGSILGILLLVVTEKFTIPLLILCLIAPLGAVVGDLIESALKRWLNAKDSHIKGLDIFPGHGGVLDRIDSLIIVTLLCYIFIIMVQTGSA